MLDKTMLAAACLVFWPSWGQAQAHAPSGPSQAALDDAVRLGTLATLAPLCGMRDDAWSFDLRRAALMDATRAPQADDETLRRAPGRDLAMAALSHAEAEALEAFAETPASNTCSPLADDPELASGGPHRAGVSIAQGGRAAGHLTPSRAGRRRPGAYITPLGSRPCRAPVPRRLRTPSQPHCPGCCG